MEKKSNSSDDEFRSFVENFEISDRLLLQVSISIYIDDLQEKVLLTFFKEKAGFGPVDWKDIPTVYRHSPELEYPHWLKNSRGQIIHFCYVYDPVFQHEPEDTKGKTKFIFPKYLNADVSKLLNLPD